MAAFHKRAAGPLAGIRLQSSRPSGARYGSRDAARAAVLLATTALTSSLLVNFALAQNLPTGGSVAAGSAVISQPSATQLTVTQSSQSAVVNYQSFSVGQGSAVNFAQPNASSAILNRVTGSASSNIAGSITANGSVYLVNPNGIAITRSGTVNAGGGFVASTLGISDSDFMAGKRTFTGNGASAAVSNAGTITVGRGGYAALIGGTVSNAGAINVPLGRVGLGSGERATLDFSGDGFLQVAVPTNAGGKGALIRNSGSIKADGGSVIISAATAREAARNAINISGVVQARSIGGRNGSITIGGGDGGSVRITGRLIATSRVAQGGSIVVTGETIKLKGTVVDASGKTGGGTINIGGNYQGQGPLQSAQTTTIDATTIIKADAITTGNGGNVVVWSDNLTTFAGNISARGGALSGNGGEAEVSGKAKLEYTGFVNLSAANGRFGNLLLDPYNVTISSAGDQTSAGFTATANNSVINITTLQNALGAANVTVSTGSGGAQTGLITVADSIVWTSGSTLTLNAAGGIAINAAILATTGGLTLSGGAGNTITATAAVSVRTFILQSGFWNQNTAVLPNFVATDFRIAGGQFQRATSGDGFNTPLTLTDIYGVQGINSQSAINKYALVNDINASGTSSWNGGAGFIPINTSFGFGGTLDGRGYAISNLTILKGGREAGLFRTLSGTVSDLGLVNPNIRAPEYVGGIAASLGGGGAITRSYVSGGTIVSTSGGSNSGTVGGLVGYLAGGNISQSYSSAAVSSVAGTTAGGTGGLVGEIGAGSISDSYATGSVTSSRLAGGLVGLLSSGSIARTYATGFVNSNNQAGGLVGISYGGTSVSQSYWNTSTTGKSIGRTSNANQNGNGSFSAQGRITSQMQDLASFTSTYSGWDFQNIWAPPNQSGQNNGDSAHYAQLYATSKVVRIAPDLLSKTYGDANPSLTYTAFGLRSGDTISTAPSLSTPAVQYSGVGSYTINGSGAAATNTTAGGAYRYVYTSGFLTVNQRPITVVADNNARVYGDDNPTLTYTATGLVNNDTLSGMLSAPGPATDVGNVNPITQGSLNNGNYAIAYTPGNLTITQRTISVTPDAISRYYGDPNPTLTYTVTSSGATSQGLGGGVVPPGSLATTATDTTGIGVYGITPGTLAGNANYALTFVSGGSLTIDRRPITVTADNQQRIYGTANPLLTYVVAEGAGVMTAGLGAGDALVGGLTTVADTTTAVGPYAITRGTLIDGSNPNYAITFVNGSLTIDPAALMITASNQSKTYGTMALLGTTGFTSIGLVTANGDTLDAVTLKSLGALSTASVNGGVPYALGVSDAVGNGLSNYTISYIDGGLTVNPAALMITASNQSKTYGTTASLGTTGFTSTGIVAANGDTLDAVTLASLGAPGSASVNGGVPYSLAASAAVGNGLSNYTISYIDGGLTVNPAALMITASNQSKTYGTTALLGTTGFTSTGIVTANGDTLNAVTLASLGALSTASVNGGVPYALAASVAVGNGLSNYTISYIDGGLTVNPAALQITASNQSKTYGQVVSFAGTEFTSVGLQNSDTIGSVALNSNGAAASANVTALPYTITASGAASGSFDPNNYTMTYLNGGLTVAPAPIAVTARGGTSVYGSAPNNPGLSATGLQNGESVSVLTGLSNSFGISGASGVVASPYALNVIGALGNPNYTVTARNAGTWIVTPAPLQVSADPKTRIAGLGNPAFTYQLDGRLFNGDTLSGALESSTTTASLPGAYPITQGSLAASPNYNLTYQGALLTVSPAPASAELLASSVIRDGLFPITLPDDAVPVFGAPTFNSTFGTGVFYADPRFDKIFVCFSSGAAKACFVAGS